MTITDIKEYNTPNRAVFISSSCSPKAAVLFRWRLSAVIAPFCWAPLMSLPLASKTWTKKLQSLSLTGFNRKPCDSASLIQSLWRHPLFCHPSVQLGHPLLPFCYSSCLLLIILCSVLGGDAEGGTCWAFYAVCNKLSSDPNPES